MVPTVQRHSSLFEAGLHKERPAEWNSSCRTITHTSHTDAMQKHTMENARESKTVEAKGFPLQCAKQINRTNTHIRKHLLTDHLLWDGGPRVPHCAKAPHPLHTHMRTVIVVTSSGSCWVLPTHARWCWAANDIQSFYCCIIWLSFETGCRWERKYEVFRA